MRRPPRTVAPVHADRNERADRGQHALRQRRRRPGHQWAGGSDQREQPDRHRRWQHGPDEWQRTAIASARRPPRLPRCSARWGTYGGGTQTIPLLPGSLAIDAGANRRGRPHHRSARQAARRRAGHRRVRVAGLRPRHRERHAANQTASSTAFAPLVVSVTSTSGRAGRRRHDHLHRPRQRRGHPDQPADGDDRRQWAGERQPDRQRHNVGGPYAVTAATSGTIPPSVSFQLTNAAIPSRPSPSPAPRN